MIIYPSFHRLFFDKINTLDFLNKLSMPVSFFWPSLNSSFPHCSDFTVLQMLYTETRSLSYLNVPFCGSKGCITSFDHNIVPGCAEMDNTPSSITREVWGGHLPQALTVKVPGSPLLGFFSPCCPCWHSAVLHWAAQHCTKQCIWEVGCKWSKWNGAPLPPPQAFAVRRKGEPHTSFAQQQELGRVLH